MNTTNLDPEKYITKLKEAEPEPQTYFEIHKEALQATIDLLKECGKKCYIIFNNGDADFSDGENDDITVRVYALGLDKSRNSLVFKGYRMDTNAPFSDWTDVACLGPYGPIYYFYVAICIIGKHMREEKDASDMFDYLYKIRMIHQSLGIENNGSVWDEDNNEIRLHIQF